MRPFRSYTLPHEIVLPARIFAQASARSRGGSSLFDHGGSIDCECVDEFCSEQRMIDAAAQRLLETGFEVLYRSAGTINIAAPAQVFERAFGCRLLPVQREVVKGGGLRDVAEFIDVEGSDLPGLIPTEGTDFADVLEGVAIEEPAYPLNTMATPPEPSHPYHYLTVPDDISRLLNADEALSSGVSGAGVKMVMIDTGWQTHPFFTDRGYRANPTVAGPGTRNAAIDEHGHGTGESANIFAVAPQVDFTMIKMEFTNRAATLAMAIDMGAQVISCSWGSNRATRPLFAADRPLELEVARGVARGVTIVFAAGNMGAFSYPGSHPDVISAGGAYIDAEGNLSASDYASGYESAIYPGRIVPDVAGLVGPAPAGTYIMLPVPAGSVMDRTRAGVDGYPLRDNTTKDDGWAAFSGTSAATPQIAGACALLLEVHPELSPAEQRKILIETAVDVTSGYSAHKKEAGAGPDVATGAGLINVSEAVELARQRCGSR